MERPVRQGQPDLLARVGQNPTEVEATQFQGRRTVEANREVVKYLFEGHAASGLMSGPGESGQVHGSSAQFLGTHQVDVPPGRRLGLIAELLERVGLQ